ncbi:hypothetical protein N7474_001666 [Penicillium riverlandense]|uniref:uncharacterized protein n=1 Tax=Penicillium riverlandense TaxID=1903569 RepID=UPI002548F6E7|nr:uncharacterized protein N7474_001666 [Penicillium riverlandense]KAJ5833355.1 hypothetical protein N7474_001666 [Penicillium riverlandense]
MLLLTTFVLPLLSAAKTVQSFSPKSFHLGSTTAIDGFEAYTESLITLDENNPVLTLDYGSEVGGFPFVEVQTPSSAVQVQLKYSEPYDGLELPQSDGPWYYNPLSVNIFEMEINSCYRLYVNGLMNSFRIETFNITESGKVQSFFIQGGFRWQSITLLGDTSLTISKIGVQPSVDIKDPEYLPGSFSTSEDMYQDVWNLGARVVQAACVDAGSQPSTWEVSDQGTLIRGQYPAVSALGNGFGNYTLDFSTKIYTGGTGWRVAGGANGGYGPYFVLTSNRPGLISSNITALPQNSLIAGYGFSIINQAILPSAPPQTYSISNVTIEDGIWYSIRTVINSTGYAISVDGQEIAFIENEPFTSYVNGAWGSGSLTDGTFGFGPYQNQKAHFKDVKVTAQNGSVIYTNSLTSNDILEEFAIASNKYSVCLDGAKRDREIWIGDFAHTARIIASSSGRFDYIQNMIDFEFDWQYPPGPAHGLVPIQAYMGAGKQYREVYYPSEFGETDYQFFFLLVLTDYFAFSDDKARLSKHWDGIKLLVQTLVDRYYDPASGLMASPDASWFTAQGTQNATAPTALFLVTLNQLVNVATVLNEPQTALSWNKMAARLGNAINTLLWNDDLGAYSLSLTQPSDSAILATAFTIRAGIASPSRIASSIARLSDVFLKIGYKDNSAASDASSTQLSPNTQGFLFESLFIAHLQYNVSAEAVLPAIRNLSEVFWPKMVTQNEYFTGAPWEYLYQDGSPGIGIFTSLGHPWGGAATYVFSNYILGVRSEWNNAIGKYEWVFDPAWDIAEGLGLEWAKGKMPLSSGGYIEAEWKTSGKEGKATEPSMTATVVGNKNVRVNIKKRF